MKKVILSIIFLISVGVCFGQNVNGNIIFETGNTGFKLQKPKGIISVIGDTVEIVSKEIKYIKIDGIVYEIKRSTTLQEVKPIFYDTSYYFRTLPTIQYLPNFFNSGTGSTSNYKY